MGVLNNDIGLFKTLIPFAATNYDKGFPKFASASYEDGNFSVEIGKPIYGDVLELEDIFYEILKEED